jgi:hypothetical protein
LPEEIQKPISIHSKKGEVRKNSENLAKLIRRLSMDRKKVYKKPEVD